jgi:flavin reductase (DIM6/NTAB) family NADH-FMN oxidoreductase RutF
VSNTRLVNSHNLFILEVVQAWRDTSLKQPRTLHHQGFGRFAVDGDIVRFKSRMP